ncbi:MAG: IS3 family transposase [Patescibacteria group bacterium]
MHHTTTTKTALARELGVARSSLYYRPIRPHNDEEFKQQLLTVTNEHPAYGHKRIAMALGWNKKKALRLMKAFHIRPLLQRKRPVKPGDQGNLPTNVPNIAKTLCPIQPHALWVGDFTYLPWHGNTFIYVATVLDVYTREILGWHIGTHHSTDLVIAAFLDACERTGKTPKIFHSDQGSEYVSGDYEQLPQDLHVMISHSKKSSPWENGYQESFYNNFKLELGNPRQYTELGELTEKIHRQLHYYNTRRIHTSIKMPPQTFRLLTERNHVAAVATTFPSTPLLISSPMSV